MLNLTLKDGERFIGRAADNFEDERAMFADILQDRLGYEARSTFIDLIDGGEEHIEAIVEEAVCEAEEPYQQLLNEVIDEIEAITDELDGRVNKDKLKKELLNIRKLITGSGLY